MRSWHLWCSDGALIERDEVAVEIEDAEVDVPPPLLAQRPFRMEDAFGGAVGVERSDVVDLDA